MKSLKKFLALALAATLACGFTGATAFADEEEQTKTNTETEKTTTVDPKGLYTNTTQLPVMKILKMAKNSAVPDAKFYFNIEGVAPETDETLDGLSVYEGPSLGTGKDTIMIEMQPNDKWYDNVTVAGAGDTNITGAYHVENFDFSGITWTQAGIYRYQVSEDRTEDKKVSYVSEYDESTFTVDVYVAKSGEKDDGTPKYAIKYIKAIDDDGNKSPIVFVNKVNTTNITITKKAEDYLNEDQTFTFWIKIPVGGDKMTLNEGDSFNSLYIDKNGEEHQNYYEIKVGGDDRNDANEYLTASKETPSSVNGWYSFQLKANESLTIQNVSVDMIYFLYEEPVTGFKSYFDWQTGNHQISTEYSEYTSITTKSTDSTVSGDAGKLDVKEGNNFDTFYNVRKMASNTGIVVDVLPYVAIVLIVAAAACIALILSKKRRSMR
jgi:pilin isopeptide linkage protein